MKNSIRLIIIALVSMVFFSCTKEIEGKLPTVDTRYIVDGYIESNGPPIILFTRSSNVFGDLNLSDFGSFLLHGADMQVWSGTDTTHLVEYCLKDLPLPDSSKAEVLKSFGLVSTDTSAIPNICIYTVPDIFNYFLTGSCSFMGQYNKTYNLKVVYDGKEMTAETKILQPQGLDSLSWKPHPTNDSLATVMANVNVPISSGNFIRYWTKRNGQNFMTPQSQSVWDDKLFSGKKIALPLERGMTAYEQMDRQTYGFFWRGDSVTVKWAAIDINTFNFYYTLENDGSDNPFGTPIKVRTNINNGFGIWAGYGIEYKKIAIPK